MFSAQVIKVAPNVYRGPEPMTELDVVYLQSHLGIETIINLQLRREPTKALWKIIEYRLREYRFRSWAFFPPSKDTVNLCMEVLRNANMYKDGFGPVYVHCQGGVDRTGFVIANYLLRFYSKSIPKKAVIRQMKALGMHWWFYWWTWFL